MGIPGELAFFADGHEAGIEVEGDGGGEDKAAGVDADDLVDFFASRGCGELVDGVPQKFGLREHGGDVFEKNAGLGKVRDVTDVVTEELGNAGHD